MTVSSVEKPRRAQEGRWAAGCAWSPRGAC